MEKTLPNNTNMGEAVKNENNSIEKERVGIGSKHLMYVLAVLLLLFGVASLVVVLYSNMRSSRVGISEIEGWLVVEKENILESVPPINNVDNEDSKSNEPVIWKEYIDLKNKISFQYPSNARLIGMPDTPSIEFQEDNCFSYGPYACAWWVRIEGIYPNLENMKIDDFLKQLFFSLYEKEVAFNLTEIDEISGFKTYRVDYDYTDWAETPPGKGYYIVRENNVIGLNIGVLERSNDVAGVYQSTVDKILSTFSLN